MTTDPIRDDPRDDNIGLQDTRDDSDPGPLSAPTADEIADFQERLDHAYEIVQSLPEDERQSWRDRYDTREEWDESRG